ncbi:hypothetical protein NCS52_01135700 [Fusarium sp. LHS14.1]|nr:hypothetical protein NCS52_01135700 [Fusarium sp. LHS14.1]
MAGVPRSRGCNNCRKIKKRVRKCDQAKPSCGRCTRLLLTCTGNGTQRWTFIQQSFGRHLQHLTASPRPSPSNETTRTASNLVSLLEIQDVRYNLRHFGGPYCMELLHLLGTNTALDASISALIASYRATQCNQSRVEALTRYGTAMKLLRTSLTGTDSSILQKIFTVINVSLCQQWINLTRQETSTHREILAHLLELSVVRQRLKEIRPEFIIGLCQIATWESMVNPRVKLGPWFWEALRACNHLHPHVRHQDDVPSSEVEIHATASLCLREPEKHLARLREIYKLIQQDKHKVHHIIEQWTAETDMDTMLRVSSQFGYRFGYGLLLSLGPRINRCLRRFDKDPALVIESYEFCDQAIAIGRQCLRILPFGAGFVPTYLKSVWASTPDAYRYSELEGLMGEYEKDFRGVGYIQQAEWIRTQFDILEGALIE